MDETFTVSECDGALVCTVRGDIHRCLRTSEPAFRVYLDRDGYAQLVFSDTPCGRPWSGSYATEGGGAPVTATLE